MKQVSFDSKSYLGFFDIKNMSTSPSGTNTNKLFVCRKKGVGEKTSNFKTSLSKMAYPSPCSISFVLFLIPWVFSCAFSL